MLGKGDVFHEQRGRKLVTASGQLDDDVSSTLAEPVLTWCMVEKLDTPRSVRGRGQDSVNLTS
jgi:hypothetical protein